MIVSTPLTRPRPHGLEIRVLQRGREDADAVDAPARRDRFRDETGRIVPRGALDRAGPLVGLELDSARPREGCGRAGGDDLAGAQDRDTVAHELDLREEVRVEQNGDTAVTHLLEQYADDSAPGRIERRGRLVEDEHPRQADERLRDPETLLHPLRHAVDPAVTGIVQRPELE